MPLGPVGFLNGVVTTFTDITAFRYAEDVLRQSEEKYRGLVESYGFDVMAWSGYSVMRDVRELLMVVWLADKSMSDEVAAAELTTRVKALKTGGSRRDWQPF